MKGPTSPTNRRPAAGRDRDSRRTDPRSGARRRDRRGGFTLLELTMALAVMALIAALALPRAMPGTTATDLRLTAYRVAAVLRADRNAAIATGLAVSTRVDLRARAVIGGSGNERVLLPRGADLKLLGTLPRFLPDGRADSTVLVISSGSNAFTVHVEPLTAAVAVLKGAP